MAADTNFRHAFCQFGIDQRDQCLYLALLEEHAKKAALPAGRLNIFFLHNSYYWILTT